MERVDGKEMIQGVRYVVQFSAEKSKSGADLRRDSRVPGKAGGVGTQLPIRTGLREEGSSPSQSLYYLRLENPKGPT